MERFYFTFGTDPAYPFGINDYVEVEAENLEQAIHLFQAVHPNRPGSSCVNCAFWYSEERFRPLMYQYYPMPPIETISVRRRDLE